MATLEKHIDALSKRLYAHRAQDNVFLETRIDEQVYLLGVTEVAGEHPAINHCKDNNGEHNLV